MTPLDLRPGAQVRYHAAHSEVWSEGELVKVSTTGEEWLVKNRLGRFWIAVTRLRPPDEAI